MEHSIPARQSVRYQHLGWLGRIKLHNLGVVASIKIDIPSSLKVA